MFTKKHYKTIAEIVNLRTFEYENRDVIDPELLVYDLTDYFAQDNPQFDRQKFLDACGLNS